MEPQNSTSPKKSEPAARDKSNSNPIQKDGSSKPITLWVGDIEKWMDGNYLAQLFGEAGHVLQAKIIRDRQTNIPVGYGFVQFSNYDTAKKVVERYGNATNPATGRKYRLMIWEIRGPGIFKNRDENTKITVQKPELSEEML